MSPRRWGPFRLTWVKIGCAGCGCIIESGTRIVVCSEECCCRGVPVSEEATRAPHPSDLLDRDLPQHWKPPNMGEPPASANQRAQHWDAAYDSRGANAVSWFQPMATVSIELIERLDISRDVAVIDIGGGASLLVDALVDRGFGDLSVLDISKAALEAARARLNPSVSVALLYEDLLAWKPERRFDVWHDRAVFHFLVDASDRETYVKTLHSALRPGGTVIMATFAEDGPEFCSGLPVARYSPAGLAEVLGPEFKVVEQFREEHVTPAEVTQPFTWVVFRSIGIRQPIEERRDG